MCQASHLEPRDWCEFFAGNKTVNPISNEKETQTSCIFIDLLTGTCSTTHPLLIGINLYPVSQPWSVCTSFTNWKSYHADQQFQAKLSPSPPYGNSELKPTVCLEFQTALPPCLQNSSPRKPLSVRTQNCHPWYCMDIF